MSVEFLASCLACFERMEKVLKNCEMFSENVNCDLNAMTSECNETRVALIKHCTHKECGSKYVSLETQSLKKD